MSKKLLATFYCMLSIVTAYGFQGVACAATTDAPRGRLQFVGTLIEKSSAARHVAASGNSQADQLRQEARLIYERALAAERAGDAPQTNRLLTDAASKMFEAVRIVSKGDLGVEKRQDEFHERMDSIAALLTAHDRVSRQKGASFDNEKLKHLVDGKVVKAKTLLQAGHPKEARQVLDEGYVDVKVAIEKLRGGDTLVRSLHFASKAEEYEYEVDRNDSHQLLVKVLLEEKVQDSSIRGIVDQTMGQALMLRSEAEQQAARGNYSAAVSTMEKSTNELLRGIRGAGVYIPG